MNNILARPNSVGEFENTCSIVMNENIISNNANESILVYPVPARDKINISFTKEITGCITIYNSLGSQMYIDKIEKEFASSPDLILGQGVHKALENLYKKINIFVIPSEAEVLDDFRAQWATGLAEATQSTPLQMKGALTLEDYLRRGEVYLREYYEKYAPFTGVKIISTEEMINFTLDPAGQQKFRGVIDRLDKEGDCFVINDYKTNKNLPSEQKEDYVEQLTLYGLALQQKYAKYFTSIKARLHYLHFNITDEREITPERLEPIVEKYRALIGAVDHEKFAYNMGDKKAFAPQQNEYCKYCEYMSICPLWAHMKYEDEVVAGELGEKTIK